MMVKAVSAIFPQRLVALSFALVLSRVFDASRELVFKVMTDPQHIPI